MKIVNDVYVGNNKKYFVDHTDLILWDKKKVCHDILMMM